MRVEALQKEERGVVETFAVIMKPRLPPPVLHLCTMLSLLCTICRCSTVEGDGDVFFYSPLRHQICQDCQRKEWDQQNKKKEARLQTAILSDNWNVGLTSGTATPQCKETLIFQYNQDVTADRGQSIPGIADWVNRFHVAVLLN